MRMFEQALGLERGDVLELRTAGATIAVPERADAANDLIRSLAGGVYLLGVREVAVIGHTQCGLSHIDPAVVTTSMQALGVDPATGHRARRSRRHGWSAALARRLQRRAYQRQRGRQCDSPQPIPSKNPVHGLVIDINTGKLELVERG